MYTEVFWEQIKKISRIRKVTQEELARTCGVPVSTFKGWIQRNYFPTVIGGYLIAVKLGVSVEYLITGREKTSRKEIEKIRLLLHRAEEKLGKIPVSA